MIKVKHPEEKCNRTQEEFLLTCPEEQKRFHYLAFSHGNAVVLYHLQKKNVNYSKQEWKEWLEGLPKSIRNSMRKIGFEECKSHLSFTRYVLEKNDIGLDEFVKGKMGSQEFEEYKTLTGL